MSICADMETDYLIRWSETPDEILIKFGQSSARIRSETLGLKNPNSPARWLEMSEPMTNMEAVPQVSLELQPARKPLIALNQSLNEAMTQCTSESATQAGLVCYRSIDSSWDDSAALVRGVRAVSPTAAGR